MREDTRKAEKMKNMRKGLVNKVEIKTSRTCANDYTDMYVCMYVKGASTGVRSCSAVTVQVCVKDLYFSVGLRMYAY